MQNYNINGKVYKSLDEVPQEFRVMLEDKNNNGIPDMFEGLLQNITTTQQDNTIMNSVVYNHNGKTYNNLADLPADKQKLLKEKLDALRGISSATTSSIYNSANDTVYNPGTSPVTFDEGRLGLAGKIFIALAAILIILLIVIFIIYYVV